MGAWSKAICWLLASILLGACSNSDDDNESRPETGSPARGSLIERPPARIASVTSSDLFAALTAGSTGQRILELITSPECGIDIHQLRYNTFDAVGEATTASGALMIPAGSDPACQGPRPIVVYAHGTAAERAYNIADITDADNGEGLLIAAVFAAQGYIVVAPNYAGYDSSTLDHHPFLNADQQARDVEDALTAARSSLPTRFAPDVSDSGKLFIMGYSQGGYVAMATHRLLQASGTSVTASAPMSGPYALAAFGDAVFYGQVVASAPLFLTFLATGYQRAYGNIYDTPTELFEAQYTADIETLLPTAGARSRLFDEGHLPSDQLFSSTPPDPAYAPYTPATLPGDLAPVFARGFGPDHLTTNAFRLAYLQDAQSNPDGGFPNTTDGLPAPSPAHGLRQAFKTNDLRNWVPESPVLLCAGNEDPTVLFMNTQLMQGYWAVNADDAPVEILDVDASISLDDPDATLKAGFAAAKEALAAGAVAEGATDGGAAAVQEAYHSTLVPPFCLAAVRSFFDGL